MKDDKIYCTDKIAGISLKDVFTKAYIEFNNTNKTKADFETGDFFGKCSYELKEEELIIKIPITGKEFNIFKKPLIFIGEKKEEISKVYNKKSLKQLLDVYSNTYEFYIDSEIKKKEEILQNEIPSQIMLKEKQNSIPFDIFKSLYIKKEIPSNEKKILINTNELTPIDIFSLGIRRNKDFTMIIDKRDKLIKEIKDFMKSNEIIMKIFGCDGIGKSITFVYLSSLINNFVTVYFNLKEFHNANPLIRKEIFKYQLINYFTDGSQELDLLTDEDKKKEACKIKFKNAIKNINNFENEIIKEYDFWNMFEKLIENIDPLNKVLFIFDQYKSENDEKNRLTEIEAKLIKNSNINIKLLIASSLNDMRVKINFINYLKLYSNLYSNNQPQMIEKNTNIEEDSFETDINQFFEDYSNEKNFLESNDSINNNFEKIKIFNDIENKEQKINKKEKDIIFNEEIQQNDLDINEKKFLSNLSEFPQKYKILYINDLISAKNIYDKENELIEKLEVFNFNPKYFIKFKDFKDLRKNTKNSLDDLYHNYLLNAFNNIKVKIETFYTDYNNKFKLNYSSNTIINKLMNLEKLVQEEIKLNINSLIYYLGQFPVKYIKIIKLDNNNDNSNFFYFDCDISSSYFKIEYAFPFIRYVISRLLFEYDNNCILSYNDISPSGIGSLLEKHIRKALVIDKMLNQFYLRNFWSFRKTSTKTKKINKDEKGNENEKISDKKEEEDKIIKFENNPELEKKKKDREDEKRIDNNKEEKQEIKSNEQNEAKEDNKGKKKETSIDFFNLKEVVLDDLVENPLNEYFANYYIIPHKPNNELLDSIILIPAYLDNNSKKSFYLVSLQITINKKKVYTLEEYQAETINAASYIEERYGITIINKYFLFVLSKEYKNSDTKNTLIIEKIPFIFFSTIDKSFYLNETEKINDLQQFLNNKYKILSIDDINENETIHNKNRKYLKMSLLLKKKRIRDKIQISKNLFDFTRRKIFNNENPLILPEKVKNRIIEIIGENKNYDKKKIIIEYIFRANFSRIYELNDYSNLLGITFYKGFMFLINNKLDSTFIIYSSSKYKPTKREENEKKEAFLGLFGMMNKILKKKEDEIFSSSNSKSTYDDLLKFNQQKPSDIFVFSIYEIS